MGKEGVEALAQESGLAAVRKDAGAPSAPATGADFTNLRNDLYQTFMSRKTWPYEFRMEQLENLRKVIIENESKIVQAVMKDLGRCTTEAVLLEIVTTLGDIDHALKNLKTWMKPQRFSATALTAPGSFTVQRRPKGVVLVISPWNYPFYLAIATLIPAIIGGNCAVLKPSEVSPATSQAIADVVAAALDPSCFRVVQGGVPETTALLEQKWDHIIYTGNGYVARIIMAAAAKHLCPVTLELGGKSPCLVDKSADVKLAARRIMNTKLVNVGQTCVAPDYVLVHKDVKSAFVEECKKRIEAMYTSDPKSSKDYGRIINERHVDRIAHLLDGIPENKIVYGGKTNVDKPNRFFPPTLVVDPAMDSDLMQQEIFGPVLPIITISSVEEAVKIVNSRERPLGLYAYARDRKVVDQFTNHTIAGGVAINDCMYQVAHPGCAFGGVGASGIGVYHGIFGFNELTHPVTTFRKSTLIDPDIRYPPYDEGNIKFIRRLFYPRRFLPEHFGKVVLALALGALAYQFVPDSSTSAAR